VEKPGANTTASRGPSGKKPKKKEAKLGEKKVPYLQNPFATKKNYTTGQFRKRGIKQRKEEKATGLKKGKKATKKPLRRESLPGHAREKQRREIKKNKGGGKEKEKKKSRCLTVDSSEKVPPQRGG